MLNGFMKLLGDSRNEANWNGLQKDMKLFVVNMLLKRLAPKHQLKHLLNVVEGDSTSESMDKTSLSCLRAQNTLSIC